VVGDAEQERRARAGLHVLERDVVLRGAVRRRVADVAQHLAAGGGHVDLLGRHAQRSHQPPGVRLGRGGGGEGGQRVGEDVAPRPAQPVHHLRRHQQRLRAVQPPRHADHHLADAGGGQPLAQAVDLDGVGLGAALVQRPGLVGHEGKTGHGSQQPDVGAGLEGQPERHAPEGRGVVARAGGEAGGPQPLGRQALEVHVGEDQLLLVREAFRLGQLLAQVVDRRVAVPGEIGGRLAPSRRRVEIGADLPRRGHAAERPAIVGLADGGVRGRQVRDHRGARHRGARRGRDGNPHVLADLQRDGAAGQILGLEDQVGSERRLLPRDGDAVGGGLGRGREPPRLVELPVGRQVGFRRDAEDAAAVQRHAAIVQPARKAQRRPDDQQRRQVGRLGGQRRQRILDRV
jgi:hypothetical protein